MIKFNDKNNNVEQDTLKNLLNNFSNNNCIQKQKTEDFTIRDIRVGTIICIHLCNDDRGDEGFCNCEIVAVFNSAGQQAFNISGDFAVVYKNKMWYGYCSQIYKIISY